MNDLLALDISGAGMRVQRERMAAVAENLANQHTTGPNGPYQRKQVIAQAVPISEFEKTLNGALSKAENVEGVASVGVAEVQRDKSEPTKVYDPSHPHADAQGFVAMPNISVFREMTDMVESSRMYEANLAASRATRDMLTSAIELIRK
jgi:flagellar basal-body rod protein FlgC